MKKKAFVITSIILLVSLLLTESQGSPKPKKKSNEEARTIGYLAIRNGGIILFDFNFSPMKVMGEIKVEEKELRFIPDTGLTEKPYNKVYQYNDLIKELTLPYSEIKQIKKNRGIVIKTKNGKRYRIIVNKPGRIIDKISPHIGV